MFDIVMGVAPYLIALLSLPLSGTCPAIWSHVFNPFLFPIFMILKAYN